MQTDLIILGGGPAGLTAGLYAARARIKVVLIEKGAPGGQMAATELVDNYPGQPDPILGYELAQKMETQARKFGLEIQQADIVSVSKTDSGFDLKNEDGTAYSCRTLILATGANPIKLGVPGEHKYAGRGVSYCAVCDGPFFRDVEVAVIGGGDSACGRSGISYQVCFKSSSCSSAKSIAGGEGNSGKSLCRTELDNPLELGSRRDCWKDRC